MASRRANPKKKFRKKFNGQRTDTETVKSFLAENGYTYRLRKDGSYYPKLTTIPLTEPTKEIYATLRQVWKFHNYDELLIAIVTKLNEGHYIAPFVTETLESRLRVANTHIQMRKRTRAKATSRHRYYHRKTGVISTKPSP